jgi:proline dehydrogenase
MNISRQLLGKKLFTAVMKATVYGHFVAGEDQDSIKPVVENMVKYGVRPILDYSVEDDLNSEASQNFYAYNI